MLDSHSLERLCYKFFSKGCLFICYRTTEAVILLLEMYFRVKLKKRFHAELPQYDAFIPTV